METTLTRDTAFTIIWPADITASCNRLVRRGWQASVAPRTVMGQADDVQRAAVVSWCVHSHKTVQAAQACGTAMWRRLPR